MRLLQLTVLLLFLVNVLSVSFILVMTDRSIEAKTGAALVETAEVEFCLNRQPSLSVPCNTTLEQDVAFSCQLNGSDPENNVTYGQIPLEGSLIFNISPGGLINFTPDNDDVGNYSINISVDDGAGCDNSIVSESYNFTVENVNDAPYLIENISDQSFPANTTLVAFFLTDYFADPDNDTLNFTVIRGLSEVQINYTLSADSQVTFYSNGCGSAFFRFTATDPFNLSAQSNLVEVESNCSQQTPSGGSSDVSTGGGGGGGGGGASSSCFPEMVCLPWSDCRSNGLQSQRCRDRNGCTEDEVLFNRNCTYIGPVPDCEENWLCSDWGVCTIDGLQNRTCEDLNECETFELLPDLEQQCVYNPSCEDGVMNGNETGVDCGGNCPRCPVLEAPAFIGEKESTFAWLALLLMISSLLALVILYREKIYEGVARFGWLMTRARPKDILLTAPEKRMLLEALQQLEESDLSHDERFEALSIIIRKYYSFALDLPYEFTLEELATSLDSLKISEELRQTLLSFTKRLFLLESDRVTTLGSILFDAVKEEARLIVCMSSEYDIHEIERELPMREVTPQLSFEEEIWMRLMNIYEGLEFFKFTEAQQEYLKILEAYDALSQAQQEELYPMIQRAYEEIKYVFETTNNL